MTITQIGHCSCACDSCCRAKIERANIGRLLYNCQWLDNVRSMLITVHWPIHHFPKLPNGSRTPFDCKVLTGRQRFVKERTLFLFFTKLNQESIEFRAACTVSSASSPRKAASAKLSALQQTHFTVCVWIAEDRQPIGSAERHTKKRIHELDFLVAQFSHPSRYHLSNFDLFSLSSFACHGQCGPAIAWLSVCVCVAGCDCTRCDPPHTPDPTCIQCGSNVDLQQTGTPSNQCGIYRLFHLDCSRSLCRLFQ